MSWREMALTLQLAAEERVGFVVRERQRLVRAQEDAAWATARGVAAEVRG